MDLPVMGKRERERESKQTMVALLFDNRIVPEFSRPGHCSAK